MKPTLPLAAALTIIMVSTAIVITLQTQTHSLVPAPVAAQNTVVLLSKVKNHQLELYVQLPAADLPLYDFTLQADLNPSNPSQKLKTGSLAVNPELISQNWRFPKAEVVKSDQKTTINLFGTSFTPGGSTLITNPYLLATVPIDSNYTGQLILIINPEISQVTVKDNHQYSFESAGIPRLLN